MKNISELKTICKEQKITGIYGLNKQSLIDLILRHQKEITSNVSLNVDLENDLKNDLKNDLNRIPAIKIDMNWNNWNNWTTKSENIIFKSTTKGVGDGEEKTAYELNTKVLGQNSDYDMKVNIDDNVYDCDVKKLDHNTFNTGVKGRNALRLIKNNISDLLNIFKTISNSSFLTLKEQKQLNDLTKVSPDEICVSNINKISDACFMLCKKHEDIQLTLPIVVPFEKKGTPLHMSLDKYFKICLILEDSIPNEYDSDIEKVIFLKNISHMYISNPKLFRESLDNLTSIFNGVKLIFVDEVKGYCIWNKMEYIKFERITRGHPRFRVCFQGAS